MTRSSAACVTFTPAKDGKRSWMLLASGIADCPAYCLVTVRTLIRFLPILCAAVRSNNSAGSARGHTDQLCLRRRND
jgi:hypothetical protein